MSVFSGEDQLLKTGGLLIGVITDLSLFGWLGIVQGPTELTMDVVEQEEVNKGLSLSIAGLITPT